MSPRKPPYFPFYVGDFLSSRAVAALSLRQIGAYVMLLAWQWDSDDCTLPADEAVLGYLSRLGDTFPTEGRPIIDLCFTGRGKKVWNSRLREERKKYDAHIASSRKGGLKSGSSRRKAIEVPLPSTMKSKASSQNQNQSHKQTTTEKAPVPGATPADQSGSAIVVPGKRTWLTSYGEAWQERFGPESEPPWGEMASEFARPNVKALGAEETLKRWQRFLATRENSDFARPARFRQGLGQWAEGFALVTTKRPTTNSAARGRMDGIEAGIRGGMPNDRRGMDQGVDRVIGGAAGQGPGAGDPGSAGPGLPEGVGEAHGRVVALRRVGSGEK